LAKIELIITGDNSGAVNALRGLANVVINVNNTINNVNNGVNNFNNQINNYGDRVRNASESTERFGKSLLNLSIIAGGAYMAITKIKDALTSLIKPGMEFESSIETGRLGVAGILMSMTQVNGQAWQLPQALKQADKYMDDVISKARKWRLSVDDVLEAYQGLFAPGLRGGMDPEQIAEYAAVMTKTAYAFNLPKLQILQEARAMLTGDIDQNAAIARSLGITPADIERAKQSSAGLFAFLMDKLSGFKAVAEVYSDTLPGKIKQLKDAFTQASSQGFKPFYEFGKTVLDDLANRILVIDKNTKEIKGINPDLLSSLNAVSKAVISIVKSLLDIGTQAGPVIVSTLRGVADILQVIAQHGREVFNVIASLFIANQLSALFGGGAAAASKLFAILKTIVEVITTVGRMAKIVFAATMANGIAGAITAMGRLVTVLRSANTALKAMQLLAAMKNPILFAATLATIANIDTIIEKTESLFGNKNGETSDWNPTGKPSRPYRDEEDAAIAKEEQAGALEIALKENRDAWDLIKSRYDVKIAAIETQSDQDQKTIQRMIQQEEDKQQADLKVGLPGNPNYVQNKSALEQEILNIQLQAKQQQREELANLIAVGENQQKQSEVNPFKNQLTKLDAAIAELGASIGVSTKEFNEINSIASLFKGTVNDLSQATMGTSDSVKTFIRAISGQESGSEEGNYDAHNENSGASGRFQIMPENWGPWVSEAIAAGVQVGYEKNAENQDKVAEFQFTKLFKEFGNWADVARAWYAGSGFKRYTPEQLDTPIDSAGKYGPAGNFHPLGSDPSINAYAASVMARMSSIAPDTDTGANQLTASADQLRDALKQVGASTPGAVKLLEEAKSLIDEASKLDQEMLNLQGKTAEAMRKQLEPQKNALVDKFNAWGLTDYADKAQKVFDVNMLKADFAQSQSNLEIANEEMVTVQIDLLNNMATGTKSATQVSDEYVKQYNNKTQAILAELQHQLAAAGDDKELANKIRAAIRGISDKLSAFFDAVIQRIDAELQNEISMINAERGLTSMQKQDAIDSVTRQKAAERADRYGKKAEELRNADKRAGTTDNDSQIIDLENSAELNRRLAETPTLLDKIHQSSKQAFEDGLLTFLTTGITECKNLGEAFRNLANSVLQSIQKIYAEAVTKNIMNMFNLGANNVTKGDAWTLSNGKKLDPTFGFADGGDVQGPGTGTSDSILARLSNGEFVIKAASVQKYGANFLHRLNNGLVPHNLTPRFATGGLVGTSVEGAAGIASSIQGGDVSVPLKVINVTDPNEVGRYLQSRNGEKVMVNFMKNNAGIVRQILNIRG
jgi:hypothetical protein